MLDTKVGSDDDKADPKDVAHTGYEAMKRGEASVVHGFGNKMRAAPKNRVWAASRQSSAA
jgi:hypothetical protein